MDKTGVTWEDRFPELHPISAHAWPIEREVAGDSHAIQHSALERLAKRLVAVVSVHPDPNGDLHRPGGAHVLVVDGLTVLVVDERSGGRELPHERGGRY